MLLAAYADEGADDSRSPPAGVPTANFDSSGVSLMEGGAWNALVDEVNALPLRTRSFWPDGLIAAYAAGGAEVDVEPPVGAATANFDLPGVAPMEGDDLYASVEEINALPLTERSFWPIWPVYV